MSNPIFISKEISIHQLKDKKLVISDLKKTIVLDQSKLQVIIQSLIDAPSDMMRLINFLSRDYSPIDVMRSIGTLKHYGIIVSSGLSSNKKINESFLEKKSDNKVDDLFCYIGNSWLVEEFKNSENNGDIVVVLTNDFLDVNLLSIQEELFSKGKPFIVAKVCGEEILLSPVISSLKGPCWHCITYRVKLNNPIYALKKISVVLQDVEESLHFGAIPVIKAVLKSIVESSRSLDKPNDSVVKLDLMEGDKSYHPVYKRPQCPCCGEGNYKRSYFDLPLLESNGEINQCMGGYRTKSAEYTYLKYQHLIDPLTGVMPSVREYRKVKGAPIYNYSSGRNIALQSRSMFWMNNHFRSSSGGKGKSEQQAKTGALCEAIERYSMVYHGQKPCVKASFNDLSCQAIDPNKCMNFSGNQILEREVINSKCTAFHSLVPVFFNKLDQLDWSSVYSLIDKKIYYLPSEFCYAQYPAEDEEKLIAYPDSNGCASGNNYAEAIIQGTLELIERDAVAIWWYNRISRPSVDLDKLENDYIKSISEYYFSINRSLYVLDITTDLGVPCFAAVSFNKKTNKEILYGFGCHLDASSAVERAIIELNQLLPIVLTERPEKFDNTMANWLDENDINSHEYLAPKSKQNFSVNDCYKNPNITDINSAVETLTNCFRVANIDLLMLDLTQPDIGMPVVKMIAPSLRHFWRRLAPGRLYDVPIKMGWRKSPITENEVNVASIVI